jgi:hypothetical protein
MDRRLLERLGACKTEDKGSEEESETFPYPEIGIGVPLATWTDLIGEGISASIKEE